MSPTATQYWEAGNYAFSKEEYAVAARCFEAAIGGGLNASSVWNNLAVSWNRIQEYDRAGWAFREALALSQVPAFVWANYGRLLIRTEEWRSAASAFDKASRLEPDNLTYVISEAYAWLKSGKPQASITLLEAVLRPESESQQGHLILVECYLAAGDRNQAYIWLKKAIPGSGNPELIIAYASLLIERQIPAEAIDWLAGISEDPRAIYLRILATMMDDRLPNAKEILAANETQLSTKQILKLSSWMAMAKGDDTQALAAWKSLVQLEPDSVSSLWGYVQMLEATGQDSEADAQLEILLAKTDDHAPGLWLKVRKLKAIPEEKLAFRKLLDRLIMLKPTWPEPRIMRAYDFLDRDLAEPAYKDFDYLIRKGNQTHDVLLGAALCAADLDQHEKGLSLFQQLSQRYPTHPQSWWNLGMAAAAAGKWRMTLEAMNQYLSLLPESSEALSFKARALFKLGKTKEAGAIWRKSGSQIDD